MSNNENLGFCITFSQFIASMIRIFYSLLDKLPKDTIIFLLLLSYAAFIITQFFRHQGKGCSSYNLWLIKVPPWVVPSIVCISFVALLLLQTSC